MVNGRLHQQTATAPPGAVEIELGAFVPSAETVAEPLAYARPTRGRRALKRSFDLIVTLILLVLAAPLIALIVVMVKLDSPGPVFYRQRRIGHDGRPFRMLKFRTMVIGAHEQRAALASLNEAGGGLFKIARDPRVTGFGRFLRSTSLDELPQLLHVLRGTMSLVGPRPLVAEEDALIEDPHGLRNSLPPGMTGAWQVAGASRIPLDEMVRLDSSYVAGWSLWKDVKLLLGTVPHVVRRRGI